MDNPRVLTVFTFRPIEMLLREGGSQAWALNAANARRCTHIVCTRNRFHDGAGPEEHGAAFLVGKISAVEPSPERPDRYIVQMSDYALLDPQPVIWPGARNPVWYVDRLADLGIEEAKLNWLPMPKPNAVTPAMPDEVSITRCSAAQLKAAFAAEHGVSADDVEVTIRF
ncbi:hypothetical protein [Amorphus orientalis]|uniref:Uncharacterized protein n=1 Tax=Amorphus orientalis TaxID=649198 RepID=A0AAE3VP21_9HYPH|nr:hypothetical protein [Amorphus orientalis]MDQ0315515.1 hypothetical protein [Amorphus orientalis]